MRRAFPPALALTLSLAQAQILADRSPGQTASSRAAALGATPHAALPSAGARGLAMSVPGHRTMYPSMLSGTTPATGAGWTAIPLLTIGEEIGGFRPLGLPDGTGVFPLSHAILRILVNHEAGPDSGADYFLANGTRLTGARVSALDLETRSLEIRSAGLAYDQVFDRRQAPVIHASQINERSGGGNRAGFSRFCSAASYRAGTYSFLDDIYFAPEEASRLGGHPHGGTIWGLDVRNRALWALPALGRGNWENVAALETGSRQPLALLLGDDTAGAPLYLWVGNVNRDPAAAFPDRNGLAKGKLHFWVADAGATSPADSRGVGTRLTGRFVEIEARDPGGAGRPGHDAAGYKDDTTLRNEAVAGGAFRFARPEDIATDPRHGRRAVLAATGQGSVFPSDVWGTLYVIDVNLCDLEEITASLTIIHDADELRVPDEGVRSPDNVTWAANGRIYVQEDRATVPRQLFGAATGIEASIWEVDPATLAFTRIAEIDRSAVGPSGTVDTAAGDLGAWESSGILDVTAYLKRGAGDGGRPILLSTVMAHGIRGDPISRHRLLEGGQILLLEGPAGDDDSDSAGGPYEDMDGAGCSFDEDSDSGAEE